MPLISLRRRYARMTALETIGHEVAKPGVLAVRMKAAVPELGDFERREFEWQLERAEDTAMRPIARHDFRDGADQGRIAFEQHRQNQMMLSRHHDAPLPAHAGEGSVEDG